MSVRLHSEIQKTDELFGIQNRLHQGDSYIMSAWAKYLTVAASGYLEISLRIIFTEFVKGKSSPAIVRYVQEQLERFQNPKPGKIMDLVKSFNVDAGRELEKYWEGEKEDSIRSIVANRNKIAHGENSDITVPSIIRYYGDAKSVVRFLDDKMNGV